MWLGMFKLPTGENVELPTPKPLPARPVVLGSHSDSWGAFRSPNSPKSGRGPRPGLANTGSPSNTPASAVTGQPGQSLAFNDSPHTTLNSVLGEQDAPDANHEQAPFLGPGASVETPSEHKRDALPFLAHSPGDCHRMD